MMIAAQLEEAVQESYATPEPDDVWPKDIEVVSSKWKGDGEDMRLVVILTAKGKKYEMSTPKVGLSSDKKADMGTGSKGRVWLWAMQAELAQLLRKGKSRRLLDAKTGRPARPTDTKLRIV